MPICFEKHQQVLVVALEGNLRRYDNQRQTEALIEAARGVKQIDFVTARLQEWDSSAAAVLYQMALKAGKAEINWQQLPVNLREFLELALAVDRNPTKNKADNWGFLEKIGDDALKIYDSVKKAFGFLGEVVASLGRLVKGQAVMRPVDFEFALEDCGYKAVGIVSLVSFMVGLILAFVGAIQLKMFDAQIYIASLVTIGMIRIMGAIMAGIIISGRTGASYAATIGTMQVNEEIDALKTFGFSVSDFLVLPRLLSLVITMPFLTMLADFTGMLGGAFVAVVLLDISAAQYWQFSVDAFGLGNFLVGIFHGFIYGIIISCCGCYYGVNCGRNADSVGVATTKAVVSSIVIMIVATGILTVIFQALGI